MTEYLTPDEVREGLSPRNIGHGPEQIPDRPDAYHLPVISRDQADALPWTWTCARCLCPARNHAPEDVIREHMTVPRLGAQLAPTLRRS